MSWSEPLSTAKADPMPPPIMVVMPLLEGVVDLVRADEVHMHIEGTRRDDAPLAGLDDRRVADHELGTDPVHHRGIAGLSHSDDEAVLYPDVAFDHPEDGIDDERILEEQIERAGSTA